MQRKWLVSSWQSLVRPRSNTECWRKPGRVPLTVSSHPTRLGFQTWSRQLQEDVAPLRKQLKDAAKAAKATPPAGTLSTTPTEPLDEWELTVGIEIHAQLNASRKLFSPASTENDIEPNSHLAPFDLAVPGSQPRFQRAALLPALRAALALGCEVQTVSHFDRKHYFYHDQPSGYQITQYYHPFAKHGQVVLTELDGLAPGEEVVVRIKQVQMEQDTAKTQEQDENTVLIDFTRAGHALIEIISMPDIHSPRVAAAYVRKVQAILNSVDAVTTGMELGGLRADVNVSVRRFNDGAGSSSYAGVAGLGQRTEIKNLSTFKGVEDAINAERHRQIALLTSGGSVEGETRGWSLTRPSETRRLRGKEGEVDYRYMPDPDIPPLRIQPTLIDRLQRTLPPLPEQQLRMLVEDYALSTADAKTMLALDDGYRLIYFQDVVEELQLLAAKSGAAIEIAEVGPSAGNWVLHELGSLLAADEIPFTMELVSAEAMSAIIFLLKQKRITTDAARQILRRVYGSDTRTVTQIVDEENMQIVEVSEDEYEARAQAVIDKYPAHVEDFAKKGKVGKLQFLKGEVLKNGPRGQLQPIVVEETLRRLISASSDT